MLTKILNSRGFHRFCEVKFVKTSNCLQLLSTETFAATVAQSAYGNPTEPLNWDLNQRMVSGKSSGKLFSPS